MTDPHSPAPATVRNALQYVVAHEWRQLRRDGILSSVVIVLAVCLGIAVWIGHAWHTQNVHDFVEVARADARRKDLLQRKIDQVVVKHQAEGKPLSPVEFGVMHGTHVGHYEAPQHAVLPPAPLGALAVGQSDVWPAAFRVTVDRERFATIRDPEHPYGTRSGRFDLTFVIVYLVPLLAIAMGTSLVSAEREEGTLPLLAMQGVTLGTLVLGKILVRASLLTVLVVTAGGVAVVVSGAWCHPDLWSIALWALVAILYGAFWFALTAFVDARGRGTAINAMTLVGLWLVLVVVIPSVSSVVTRTVRPVPTRAALDEARAQARQVVWGMGQDSVVGLLLQRYPQVDSARIPRRALERFMAFQMYTLELIDASVAPIATRFAEAVSARRAFANTIVYLSPATLVSRTLRDVAGTGEARYAEYGRQVEHYRGGWTRYFALRIYHRVPITDLSVIPHFVYREEPTSAVVRRALVPIILLAVLTALCFWGAARGYRRYPVVG